MSTWFYIAMAVEVALGYIALCALVMFIAFYELRRIHRHHAQTKRGAQ
ncbi:hypothetical protein [Burkholderia multivorans]|nr:hypothetical protein [Burkholderia multivorans]MBU9310882.1 hypothetical protein [Burkholderia multivorans]